MKRMKRLFIGIILLVALIMLNQNILNFHDPKADAILKVVNYPGPITLVLRSGSKEILTLAASTVRSLR